MNNLQRWNDIIEKINEKENFLDPDTKKIFNHGYLHGVRRVGAISAKEYTSLFKVHASYDFRGEIKDGSLINWEVENGN